MIKIIEPSVEVEDFDGEKMLKKIEAAGRTCYQSFGKIEADSWKRFVRMILERGHLSVLEHEKITATIITDRGVTHELVRHRIGSYCLSGDTKILRFNQNRGGVTIKELYDRQKDFKLSGKNKLIKLRSMNKKGVLVPNKIKKVICSGEKDVYEVTTSLGYKIKASKDHIFFGKKGEVKLGDLKPGNRILVNGENVIKSREWLYEKYKTERLSITQISFLAGVAYSTVRKYIRLFGLANPVGYKPKNYCPWNKELRESNDFRVGIQANALREHHHNNGHEQKNSAWKGDNIVSLSGKRLRFSKYEKKKCSLCGSINQLENHHKDKNPENWFKSNKLVLCMKCHKLLHLGKNVKHVIADKIISIKYAGKEMTYDIEMQAPFHNFVANGFVVHNSQESTRYVNYKEGLTLIRPFFLKPNTLAYVRWCSTMRFIAESYKIMMESNCTAQEARSVLPNSLKTQIVVTFNLRQWRHFFELRCHKSAHPSMIQVAKMALEKLHSTVPIVFDDLARRYL